VRQAVDTGNYVLTLRVVSLGLRHLASSTIGELAKPVLTGLATESGQLVRLGLLDGDQLLWVGRAQGARGGLRYDPDVDHGSEIPFASSASGVAWLSYLADDAALRFVARQEPETRHTLGDGAPRSLAEVMERIRTARERGWSFVHDSYEEGISAMATPLIDPDAEVALGVVSIAGPSLQLTDARMDELAPALKAAAAELAGLSAGLAAEVRSRRRLGALA
jgi:DNA-binding IclR family transcriptional regulator